MTTAYTADPHYCMIRFADGLTAPRQLAIAPNGDVFVATTAQIEVLFDANGDGVSDAGERTTFAAVPSGNHGLAVTPTHVYASSPTNVYRWAYASGDRTATGAMETVVNAIPGGGHAARTLVIDAQHRLYVTVGSAGNVDAPAGPTMPPDQRALIRRFNLDAVPTGGYPASAGEVFAYGLRNETALSIDSKGRLWGAENGRDNLMVGGDIHFDNPAEEVNLFDTRQARPQLRLPVLLERGDLDGHGDGEGARDAAPGSRSTGRLHGGDVPGQERRRPARVRARRAPRAARHRRVPRRRLPVGDVGRPVRHLARLVEPRDRSRSAA